jgi:hypothetical protein
VSLLSPLPRSTAEIVKAETAGEGCSFMADAVLSRT